jgi:hypothetical protein
LCIFVLPSIFIQCIEYNLLLCSSFLNTRSCSFKWKIFVVFNLYQQVAHVESTNRLYLFYFSHDLKCGIINNCKSKRFSRFRVIRSWPHDDEQLRNKCFPFIWSHDHVVNVVHRCDTLYVARLITMLQYKAWWPRTRHGPSQGYGNALNMAFKYALKQRTVGENLVSPYSRLQDKF